MLSKYMFEEVWGTYGARGRFALWAISESVSRVQWAWAGRLAAITQAWGPTGIA